MTLTPGNKQNRISFPFFRTKTLSRKPVILKKLEKNEEIDWKRERQDRERKEEKENERVCVCERERVKNQEWVRERRRDRDKLKIYPNPSFYAKWLSIADLSKCVFAFSLLLFPVQNFIFIILNEPIFSICTACFLLKKLVILNS